MFSARDVWKKETQTAEGCLTNDDAKAGFHCLQHRTPMSRQDITLLYSWCTVAHTNMTVYQHSNSTYTEGQYPERD